MEKGIENKVTLETRVRKIAKNGNGKGVGMPKWFTLPQNKERRLKHIDICKKLCELSDKHSKYPITYLVYFAIGKNAHRTPTFLNGYTKIDEKKAVTIFSWLKLFAKHNKNPKLFRNANLAHALCRFYDTYSKNTKDFKAALEKYEPNAKVKDFTMVAKGLGIAKKPKNEEALTEEIVNEPSVAYS